MSSTFGNPVYFASGYRQNKPGTSLDGQTVEELTKEGRLTTP